MPSIGVVRMVLLLFFLLNSVGSSLADYDLEEAKDLFQAGDFAGVLKQSTEALKDRQRGEDWQLLNARALLATGKYTEAREAIIAAHRFNYYSIRIRLLAYEILRSNGASKEAEEMLEEINTLGGNRRWGYREPLDLIALGEAAVLLGADPKLVLENFFGPVKKNAPETLEVYLAIGNLALRKHDYALAGRSFQEGLQKFPKNPELLQGLAEALEPGERKEMIKVLEQIFDVNENHVRGRLLLAEHLIDAEEYEAAEDQLKRVERVNPHFPDLWAFRALLAHLRTEPETEESARSAGLRFWANNPRVDYLIGRKLSQKYRFAEGEKYQRKAISFDSTYLPARIQLAQDLLRLGEEEEGWKQANYVFKADAYDVSAYNLVNLHDNVAKFAVLTNEHFVLRMSQDEAKIYGAQALELLNKARAQLTRKYGMELETPTTVEIFPNQKDFAVRTFGMPGGDGYLGVCFGNVITANSPGSHTMNWHSVLWHEFCHVVTLNLTRNKMPRWLSEGISVYEERRASERWGEQINPEYRQLIVEGKMKPIADLSSAFMAPPTGTDLQFAYYQSSLVVEFLVERFGLESIRAILKDLGEGKPINEALVAHTAPLEELEKDFVTFSKALARQMGPDSVWEKSKERVDPVWEAAHPENFWVIRKKAEELIEDGEIEKAIPVLEELIRIYPGQSGAGSAYALLAEVHRKDKDAEKERAVLSEWVKRDGEAEDALGRLLELDAEAKDTEGALHHAQMLLEIDPLSPAPHRTLAEAAEQLGNREAALASYQTLLALDPPNRSEVHFRLARLLRGTSDSEAKRHVVLALEEAPRFRKAHELLLELAEKPENRPAP